jgi:hypothetical protein
MACICRFANQFTRFWDRMLTDALMVEENPEFLNISPAPAQWEGWDIEELQPQQCLVAARHAATDSNIEKLKIAGIIAGGALITALGVSALLVVTASVIYASLLFFSWLAAIAVAESLLLGVAISMLGGGVLLLEAWSTIAAIAMFAISFWTKGLIPAINRCYQYNSFLEAQAGRLELAAARA